MIRDRLVRQLRRGMVVVVLLGASVDGPRQTRGGEQEGESRTEPLVDSRVLVLSSGSIIRQGDTPVIDTTSRPDQEVVSLRTDVLFAFGSAELSPEAQGVIDQAASQIEALAPTRLVITGHTDSIGDDASNQALSESRAAAVDAALRARLGAAAPATEVAGRGESEPVAPNELPDGSDNLAGRALNRRVQVEVIS